MFIYFFLNRTWGSIYIPFLLENLIEVLEATHPFIIGLSKQVFAKLKECSYFGDMVLIDLDENSVVYEEDNEVINKNTNKKRAKILFLFFCILFLKLLNLFDF